MIMRWLGVLLAIALLSAGFLLPDLTRNIRFTITVIGGVGLVLAIWPKIKSRNY